MPRIPTTIKEGFTWQVTLRMYSHVTKNVPIYVECVISVYFLILC